MMEISERTVTRLFNKAKTLDTEEENVEVNRIVDKFIADQDQYRGATKPRNKNKSNEAESSVTTRRTAKKAESDDDSKKQTGLRLLAMNVKVRKY